jgi:hypothetical protein
MTADSDNDGGMTWRLETLLELVHVTEVHLMMTDSLCCCFVTQILDVAYAPTGMARVSGSHRWWTIEFDQSYILYIRS